MTKIALIAVALAAVLALSLAEARSFLQTYEYDLPEPSTRRRFRAAGETSQKSKIPGRPSRGGDEVVNGKDVFPAFKYEFLATIFYEDPWFKNEAEKEKEDADDDSVWSSPEVSTDDEFDEDENVRHIGRTSSRKSNAYVRHKRLQQASPKQSFRSAFCGGTFLTPNIVLTAAHCFERRDAADYTIHWHRHDLYKSVTEENGLSFKLKRAICNPEFDSYGLTHDVCVLVLDTEAVANDLSVQKNYKRYLEAFETKDMKVTLDDGSLKNRTGLELTIMGWGDHQQHYRMLGTSNVVQNAIVPIADAELCKSRYNMKSFDTVFCAGYEEGGTDTCQGDSGGPVVYVDPKTNSRTLVGVVSWGRGCAAPKYFGVYASVGALRGWIERQMKVYATSF